MIGSLLRALFGPPWTAGVTLSSVALAATTRNPEWIPRGERFWAAGLLRAWGVRVSLEGAEHLAGTGPYILMSNHLSHVDVPVLFSTLPVVPGFLAKQELDRVPFLSMALRAGGHVLVDRDRSGSALRAVKQAATEVKSGRTLAIFPEGTRGHGGVLGPFKKGGFLIARRAGLPVVPIGIRGSGSILPRGGALPRPGSVDVHVGAAISPEEVQALTADGLIARVQADIGRLSGLRMARVG